MAKAYSALAVGIVLGLAALGGAIGMGYVSCKYQSKEEVLESSYEIEVAGLRVEADVSLRPMYDPKAERVKS